MPNMRSGKSSKELLTKVENWARQNQNDQNPFVAGITEALKTGKDLAFWSNYSAVELLPESQVNLNEKLHSRAQFINQMRNVLVFAPIAFTWASISVATTNYAKFTRSAGNINLNFLIY